MGHHLVERLDGGSDFQSDKHPGLPLNRIRLNLENPRSWPAAHALADSYEDVEPELSSDLRIALASIKSRQGKREVIRKTEDGEEILDGLEKVKKGDVIRFGDDPDRVFTVTEDAKVYDGEWSALASHGQEEKPEVVS